MFAGERLREAGVPGLNTQLIKEIPSLWKALSDDEKQVCIQCHTYIIYSVVPAHLSPLFLFDVGMGESLFFDVVAAPNHALQFCLEFAWGEHLCACKY